MINAFTGKFSFLSNFSPHPIVFEGMAFATSEHTYQAAKTIDPAERLTIQGKATPGQAKRAGKRLTLRPNWEVIKVEVMTEIIRIKFTNSALAACLLMTGDEELVEENTWRDTFWGTCNGVGQNHLGRILMLIRSEIKQALEQN